MAKMAHKKMFSVMGNTNLKQIKISLCFYQIKEKTKSSNTREQQGCRKMRTFEHCQWESSLALPVNMKICLIYQFRSVPSLSHFQLFATPRTAVCQASVSFTISRSLCKLMSIELVMPSNHLILCRPILLLPSIFPSIRVFSNESVLCNRWPKYWFQCQHQSFQ